METPTTIEKTDQNRFKPMLTRSAPVTSEVKLTFAPNQTGNRSRSFPYRSASGIKSIVRRSISIDLSPLL